MILHMEHICTYSSVYIISPGATECLVGERAFSTLSSVSFHQRPSVSAIANVLTRHRALVHGLDRRVATSHTYMIVDIKTRGYSWSTKGYALYTSAAGT